MIGRFTRGAALAGALTLACAAPVLAAKGGAGTETHTEHIHGVTVFEAPAIDPCNGAPGTIAVVATNGVFHTTTQADGNLWATGTIEGVVTFTPSEAGGVSASGHFSSWFGEAVNEKNNVEHDTFNAQLTGTDGSHVTVHENAHLSTNGRGEVTVSFEKMRATCAG
jgi:hypothetical protein